VTTPGFPEGFFARADDASDTAFYAFPRFVAQEICVWSGLLIGRCRQQSHGSFSTPTASPALSPGVTQKTSLQ